MERQEVISYHTDLFIGVRGSVVGYKRRLRLIRLNLQSGIMIDGTISQGTEVTPESLPLSPLLSNVVIYEFDWELERHVYCFVRYADDYNIYVRSLEEGTRVMQSISAFIKRKLQLKVNSTKSKVCSAKETKFLGYTHHRDGSVILSALFMERLKSHVRQITRRNRGGKFEQVIAELNNFLRGRFNNLHHLRGQSQLLNLDCWIRRLLRCYHLKQCKRVIGMQRFLESGENQNLKIWILALSRKEYWCKFSYLQESQAMSIKWFDEEAGLFIFSLNYERLKRLQKPPCARACTAL